ncbi:MAG: hypothetical protein KGI67_09275 [Pseudomonadota bacterium]|nr:hypothetical protein [Pseudomonadota bacterium]
MSIFHPAALVCASCGAQNTVQRTASVNADRRPELRAAILDRSFQQVPCDSCGMAMRLAPHLTYLDVRRGQWFMVEPASTIECWQNAEQAAFATWDRAFGSQATPQGRALGEALQARLVLGWPALREKLVCADLGMDDVTLELLKIDLLRDMQAPPLADQSELRLVAGDAALLRFDWMEVASERVFEGLEVARDAYDALVAAGDDWADLRAHFDGTLLVDWRRLLFMEAGA